MNENISKPKFIDLFAGLGGFRLGMQNNDMECVLGSDFNAHAAKIYEANFGENIHSDVTQLDVKAMPDFNIMCGGFPCQPFSRAGKMLGFEDTRGTLFFDICRIIEEKRPEVVFLENVKNLKSHDSGKTYNTILESLTSLGYTVSSEVLNAVDFGVPQSRERIIIVAHRDGKKFDFSKVAREGRKPLKDFLEPPKEDMEWLDANDYVLLDDVKVQAKTNLVFAGYKKANMRKNGVRPDTEHLSRSHRQPNRIYSDEGAHPTLSSQESSGRYFIVTDDMNGDRKVRKLTMVECYKIFGYPETYKRVGSVSEQYTRIGNSICVPMVDAVASQIKAQLL